MFLDNLNLNKEVKIYFLEVFETNKFPNAIFFYSEDYSEFINIVVSAAVCESSGFKPCFKCSSCKKAKSQCHPDIIFVKSKSSTLSIGVEEIRKIKKDAYIKPNESQRKVYIIENAEKLTHQAQNALLKILEDPPGKTLFVLISPDTKKILETVLSRCQRFYLPKKVNNDLKCLSKNIIGAIIKNDESKIFIKIYEASKNKDNFEKVLNSMLNIIEENILNLDFKIASILEKIINDTLKFLKQNVYLDLLGVSFSSRLLEASKECYGKVC